MLMLMTNNQWMPENFEAVPQTSSDFMKLQLWENRFRIMSNPIVWYATWVQEEGKPKPLRSKEKLKEEPSNINIGQYWKQFNKYFRAFVVWDYREECFKFLDLNKQGVLSDMENQFTIEWKEDPRMYDISITKSWSGTDTEYKLWVKDNKEVTADIKNLWKELAPHIDMDKHYEWGYVLKDAIEARDGWAVAPAAWDDLPF